jgi:hypothetical protein
MIAQPKCKGTRFAVSKQQIISFLAGFELKLALCENLCHKAKSNSQKFLSSNRSRFVNLGAEHNPDVRTNIVPKFLLSHMKPCEKRKYMISSINIFPCSFKLN